MKLLSLPTFILFCCAGLAHAQNCVATALSVIPSCAQNCIINGATAVGCGGTDFGCQCQKTAALFAAADGCVSSACPSASYQAVIDGASTVCGCVSPLAVAGAAGTASVSGVSGVSGISGTVPASNPASATATSLATTTTTTTTTTGGSASGSSPTGSSASSATSGESDAQGNGATWTGYTSVAPVATASVVGAAAQATPAVADVLRYVVAVAVVGAGVL